MDLNVPSVTALVLVPPCLLGAVLARFGDGRWLWSAALAALVLSLLGLSTFTSAIAQQGLTVVIGAYALSYAGAVLAAGACVSALVRAWRIKQMAWFFALLVTAALPLLAAIALHDYLWAVLAYSAGGAPGFSQSEQLAFALLSIGSAVLLVYGVRLAIAVERSSADGVS
jgi:hypothetical protein